MILENKCFLSIRRYGHSIQRVVHSVHQLMVFIMAWIRFSELFCADFQFSSLFVDVCLLYVSNGKGNDFS